MSAIELVEKNKGLTEQQIREGLEGISVGVLAIIIS